MRIAKVIAFLLLTQIGFSQDRLGMINSNYMPVNAVLNNPSSIVDAYTWLDIELFGASVFFHNDYLSLPANNLTIKDRFSFNFGFDQPLTENTSNFQKNFYVDFTAQLPSATLVFGRHSFGLQSNFRTYVDVQDVPVEVARGLYNGFNTPKDLFGKEIDAGNMKAYQMSWLEVGASYGTFLYVFDRDLVTIGGTIKKLWGVSGLGSRVDEWGYTTVNDTLMIINEFEAQVAQATGFGSGKGWSGDFGVTYKKMLKWSDRYRPNNYKMGCFRHPYLFKLQAAIVDLGFIKYSTNATHTTYSNGSNNWDNYNSSQVNDVGAIAGFYSSMFSEDGVTIVEKSSFNMLLPTALTVGFDYNLGYGFYAAANAVYGFPRFLSLGVQRPFQLAVMPRFESKYFDVSLPISTIKFEDFRVGFMARLWFLYVGTDRLNTFLFGDVEAADFYLGIKIPFFTAPPCKKKKKKTKKAPFCPDFG